VDAAGRPEMTARSRDEMTNPALPILAILAGSLALSGTARGADSVVLGHGITNQYYAPLTVPGGLYLLG
jgi:hypothetical protein